MLQIYILEIQFQIQLRNSMLHLVLAICGIRDCFRQFQNVASEDGKQDVRSEDRMCGERLLVLRVIIGQA